MALTTTVKAVLTHKQRDQFGLAIDRKEEQTGERRSLQQTLEGMIRRFCVDQGVRFDLKRHSASSAPR